MVSVWATLSEEKRDYLLARKEAGELVEKLAAEIGMKASTLDRRLREWKQRQLGPVIEVGERPLPTYEELFEALRKGPVSLRELSRRYDRSEDTIRMLLNEMEQVGYVIEQTQRFAQVNTEQRPQVVYQPARTLADELGQDITFAVASDGHAGSTHAQPSARARFIQIAYEEYGVRHIFDPGDVTTGVDGYRGQEFDIIPPIRPYSRADLPRTVEGQVWLADTYTPRMPGLTYYTIGGNHDYFSVKATGIDPVRRLAQMRDDHVYLGYDVADIPLTDRISVRLWHPDGGVTSNPGGRLLKGLDRIAYDELIRALEERDNPKAQILIAGHVHIEVKFQRDQMVAVHPGCFEGSTNYVRRKGYKPVIGGAIFKIRVTDSGLIQRVGYEFISFSEVEDDWMNWATPSDALFEPDVIYEPLFKIAP